MARPARDYVGRPTPLYRAERLAAELDLPEGTLGELWLKREDLCHTGAHKINNALGQVLLAKRLGKTRIIAETGAGQHGVATATAAAMLGLPCEVYMGEVDVERQAPNVARMRMLGAHVIPVESGSRTLKDAMNEALRDWVTNVRTTHYCVGSAAGPHPYPLLVARAPARDRRRGARSSSSRGRAAGRGRRLRRRRLQRDRHVPRVHRTTRSRFTASRPPARAWRAVSTPRR